jgi:hypothetical protein
MQRMKEASVPPQRPSGSLLAGALIGSAILTMATQAALFGFGSAAIGRTSRKQR